MAYRNPSRRPIGYHRARRKSRPALESLELRLVLSQATQIAITIEPPSSPIVQDGFFGTTAAVEDSSGNVVTGFSGSATISLLSGPAGATFTPVTVPVTDGAAVFDGLSLVQLSHGTDYVFQVSTTIPTVGEVSTTTTGVDVGTAATPNVGNYYPLPRDSSLRGDIGAANANGDATNNIIWIYDAFYPINNGQIYIDNASALPGKTLNMVGVFTDPTESPDPPTAKVGGGSDAPSRLFEIMGNSSLNVNITGIDFYGGQAVDDGGLSIPGIAAAGGAFLIDGGNVHMSGGGVSGGSAIAPAGGNGASGAANGNRGATGGPGGNGGNGGNAAGGGIFLDAGCSHADQRVSDEQQGPGRRRRQRRQGRQRCDADNARLPIRLLRQWRRRRRRRQRRLGGRWCHLCRGRQIERRQQQPRRQSSNRRCWRRGGAGGRAGILGFPFNLVAGNGGNGGDAANGSGGAIFIAAGTVTIQQSELASNAAVGGNGGNGGRGGTGMDAPGVSRSPNLSVAAPMALGPTDLALAIRRRRSQCPERRPRR